jgi:hypothetical protein
MEKTSAVELALSRLINRASPASSLINDDFIDDQERAVVQEYEKLTGRSFNAKDASDLKAIRERGR